MQSLITYDDDVVASLEALRRVIEAHRTQKKRSRNALLKVHRLPVEVLVDILHKSLRHNRNEASYYRRVSKLSTVSFLWYNIIQNTWFHISNMHHPTANFKALQKSKNHAIDVHFPSSWESEASSKQPLLIETACDHIERWQSVVLGIPPTKLLLDRLQAPAPKLHWIDIAISPAYPRVINLFSGQTRSLRNLRISGLSIPWNSGMLSGLRSLVIRRPLHGPPLSELTQILLKNPRLGTLILEDIGAIEQDATSNLKPVPLPTLHTLQMIGKLVAPINALLSRLQAPCVNSFVLKCSLQTLQPSRFVETITRFLPAAPATTVYIKLEFTRLEFEVSFADTRRGGLYAWPGRTFKVVIEEVSASPMLDALVDMLHSITGDPPINIDFGRNFDLEANDVITSLSRCDNVSSIKLDNVRGLHLLVHKLTVTRTVDGAVCWFFPQLKELVITQNDVPLASIRAMVISRYDGTQSDNDHESESDNDEDDEEPLPEKLPAAFHYLQIMKLYTPEARRWPERDLMISDYVESGGGQVLWRPEGESPSEDDDYWY